jgi:hypothetical protein
VKWRWRCDSDDSLEYWGFGAVGGRGAVAVAKGTKFEARLATVQCVSNRSLNSVPQGVPTRFNFKVYEPVIIHGLQLLKHTYCNTSVLTVFPVQTITFKTDPLKLMC